MRYKPLLAALVALSMLFSAVSCGMIVIYDTPVWESQPVDTGEPDETLPAHEFADYTKFSDPTDGRALAEELLAALPKADYAGETFFLSTPVIDYISPDDTSTVVSRLVAERNATVEELLNVNIITTVEGADAILDRMERSVLSGVYYSDLLMIPSSYVGKFQSMKALVDMQTMPHFDLDMPYFNNSSSDATSAGYATYAVAGDASLNPESYIAVYLNSGILREFGFEPEEIYSAVASGAWTWDKLLEYTAVIGEGGKYNTLTTNLSQNEFIDIVFKSAGNDYVLAKERKTPIIGYKPETAAKTIDNLRAMYSDPAVHIGVKEGVVQDFAAGNTLFMVEKLHVLDWMINSDVQWGVAPLPTGEGGDSYRSVMSSDHLMFAVPINHSNTEMVSLTLMALNAASHGYIHDEFVEYNMTYVLRDNGSVNMLDMILDTATFDFALTFGRAYPEIADATYNLVRSSIENEEWDADFKDKMMAATELMRENFWVAEEEPEEAADPAETTDPAETEPAETK